MSESFGENITPARAIRQILDSYPFSVGLFRELLQNSDDAKATRQIFVLDHRSHAKNVLLDPYLQQCQGPALLAYNNGILEEQDWTAIREISNSSKRADTSKIGKYGLGFRSCYHVTDHPHILSGPNLAIFDPEKKFNEDGGIRVSYLDSQYSTSDHIAAFESCTPSPLLDTFSGTVIRLPLRLEESAEGLGKAIPVHVIHELLHDFAKDELKVVLLFLRHVTSVELREVDDHGTRILAKAQVERNTVSHDSFDTCHIMSTVAGEEVRRSWIIHHHKSDFERIRDILSARLHYDVGVTLIEKKLQPTIGLAFPVQTSDLANTGRLFTFLPLPIYTGFPCHIHGLFALTPDRQHLVNAEETGLPEGSLHRQLIEWNRVLFDTVLPAAWSEVLEHFALRGTYDDIFDVWPAEQPQSVTGDVAYWVQLPGQMARLSASACIWPVHRPSAATFEQHTSIAPFTVLGKNTYDDLSNVLSVPRSTNDGLCDTLTTAGVNITQVPPYIYLLLDVHSPAVLGSLGPRSAWQRLFNVAKSHEEVLLSLKRESMNMILEYLVSEKDVTNVIGLPFFATRSHANIALQAVQTGSMKRVLLSASEDFFADFDGDAILLRVLPAAVSQVLLSRGHSKLDIEELTGPRIHRYVASCIRTAIESDAGLNWLLAFWDWLPTSEFENEMMSSKSFLALRSLPSLRGAPYAVREGVFACGDNLDLATALETLSYHVLHLRFSRNTARMLHWHKKLSFPDDLRALVRHLPSTLPPGWNQSSATALRDHVASVLSRHGTKKRLEPELRTGLRSLPIYEVCLTDTRHPDWTYIAPGNVIANISVETQLVPTIPATTFVRSLDSVIAKHLDNLRELGRMLTYPEITDLAVDHLSEQSKSFRARFVRNILTNKDSLPPKLLNRLQRTSFVETTTNTGLRHPLDLLDPECNIAGLYRFDSPRLPSMRDSDSVELVTCLSSLHLLRTTFTPVIIEELILYIADLSNPSEHRHTTSCGLLDLIRSHKFQCAGLSPKPSWAAWLPTEDNGFARAQECFDPWLHKRELFDQVMPVLAAEMSTPLRKLLGMGSPVSTQVVVQQLDATLQTTDDSRKYERLLIIYMELGRRHANGQISEEIFHQLTSLTANRAWIPIEPGITLESKHAAFDLPFPDTSGLQFRSVPSDLSASSGVRDLFERMGCPPTPSNQALVDELASFSGTLDFSAINLAVMLLTLLGMTPPNDDTLRRIQVPDSSSIMRPFTHIFYDDLGHRVTQVEVPPERYPSHMLIDRDLARRLRFSFFSSIALPMAADEMDEDDMEEKLTTRISNVLRQYTPERSFIEFVANAIDAGAQEVDVLLDEATHPRIGDFLTQSMAEFQGPSLVVHNNAIFQDKDWKGIRQVGRGGKQGNSDTIGRFGLGALSMFHFTEVAMIVSNKHVMLIDPSRQHITSEKKVASRRMTLQTARHMYSEHLRPLDGLYGFSLQSDHYDGTLFRLALRTPEQAAASEMTDGQLELNDLVMDKFHRTAEDCLIFAPMTLISGRRRDSRGRMHEVWSWRAKRVVTANYGVIRRTEISVAHVVDASVGSAFSSLQKWVVVEKQIDRPMGYNELKDKHRMPSMITVGLAAPTRMAPHEGRKLFSSMPLPVSLPLPFHINASFILADDRRNIRFDESGMGNPETEFNLWLLSDAIPSLYPDLLVTVPTALSIMDWWPRQRSLKHHLAGPMVRAFYKNFTKCTAPICVDVQGQRVSPQDAVFLPVEPHVVSQVYRDIVRPSKLVYLQMADLRSLTLSAGATQMTADHACTYLAAHRSEFIVAYEQRKVASTDIQALIDFLGPSRLKDLPLLLLANEAPASGAPANGTLTSFSAARKLTFIPSPSTVPPWPFLPHDRFVHPDVNLRHCIQQQELRLAPLNSAAIGQLIRDRIPDGPVRNLTPDDTEWAKLVWLTIHKLVEPRDNPFSTIASLPLIPTANGITHVSLQACTAENSQILIASPSRDRSIREILQHFGASFIETETFPQELQKHLEKGRFDFESAMRFLHSIGPVTLRSMFNTLGSGNQKRLSDWILGHIERKAKRDLMKLPVLAHLPIWICHRGTSEQYEDMSTIYMLPAEVRARAVREFMPQVAVSDYSQALEGLGKAAMSFSQIRDKLVIPERLEDDDRARSYHRLVSTILDNRHQDRRPPVVPNGSGVMVLPSTLFASNEAVFSAAFASQPERFIDRRFIDQETALIHYGLNGRADVDTFLTCAQVIDQDTSDSRFARASVLYACFSDRLPREVAHSKHALPEAWRRLQNMKFVPAHSERRRGCIWSHDYAERLEENALRSPSSMLRSEFQGIAWTQRFLFAEEPSALLQFTDPVLGMPTARNVVDHLIVLSTRVALDHPQNETVLQDLRETYSWLAHSDRIKEAGRLLLEQRELKLWLNVNNPQEDNWELHSASQIVFNGQDSERNHQRESREWLSNYRSLLLASGARQIQRPTPPVIQLTSVEAQDRSTRHSIDQMRSGRRLTDVIFVADDGQEIAAHRVWMATASTYFYDMFAGASGFSESSDSVSPNNPVRINVHHSSIAIHACIGFVYLRTVPDGLEDEALVDTLKLAHFWDIENLFQKLQQLLVAALDIHNWEFFEQAAGPINATHVLKACREFVTKNASQL